MQRKRFAVAIGIYAALGAGCLAVSVACAQDPYVAPQNAAPLPYGNVVLPVAANNPPIPAYPPGTSNPPAPPQAAIPLSGGPGDIYQAVAPLPGAPGGPMAAPPVMPSGVATLPPATPAIAPPKVWEGSVDLGLDGSEGNTDTLNFHVGAKLKHRSDGDTFTSEFNYHENTSGGTTQTDHGIVEERYEHQLGDSLLTCYIHDSLIYDEFKTYRLKDSSDAGLGFQFLTNDLVKLTGRFGGGETYECDGIPQPEWLSEIVFGGDGELAISKLQKLCGSVEYRPEWSDFSNYRLNAKASWEIVLDEVRHLSMKISVIDEYDAAAGFGKKPNDLDYAISMQLSF